MVWRESFAQGLGGANGRTITPSSNATCGWAQVHDGNKGGTRAVWLRAGNGSINTGSNYVYSRQDPNDGAANVSTLGTAFVLDRSDTSTTHIMFRFWNLNVAAPLVVEWVDLKSIGTGQTFWGGGILDVLNCDRIEIRVNTGNWTSGTFRGGFNRSKATIIRDTTATGTIIETGLDDYDEVVACSIDNSTATGQDYWTRMGIAGVAQSGGTDYWRNIIRRWEAWNHVNASTGAYLGRQSTSTTRGGALIGRALLPGTDQGGTRINDRGRVYSHKNLAAADYTYTSWSMTNSLDDDWDTFQLGGVNRSGVEPLYMVGYQH